MIIEITYMYLFVQVGVFYNVLNGDHNPYFDLRVSTNGTNMETFTVTPCAR